MGQSQSDGHITAEQGIAGSTIAWNVIVPALAVALMLGASVIPALTVALVASLAVALYSRRSRSGWRALPLDPGQGVPHLR
jgi:multisubunit Na+/H+ antiporter MnhC subunit